MDEMEFNSELQRQKVTLKMFFIQMKLILNFYFSSVSGAKFTFFFFVYLFILLHWACVHRFFNIFILNSKITFKNRNRGEKK